MKLFVANSKSSIILLLLLSTFTKVYSQDNATVDKTVFGIPLKANELNPKSGQIRCITSEYEKFIHNKNPKLPNKVQFEEWLSPLVARYTAARKNSKIAATVITIPVVVHVIYSGQSIGTAPNITDEQVLSQITVLNQDFRRAAGSRGYNTNPVGADVEIQFVLAQQDPKGNPTNGIDRVSLCQATWSETDIENIVKPSTSWDPDSYLNIWTLKFTDDSLLGYARSPDSSGLSGLDASNGSANTDGVVSSYDVFGSRDYGSNFLLIPTYNRGRTMTHEMGHFFGLRHIWGDANCGDDYCADTPRQNTSNFNCPTNKVSCDAPTLEMVENYMDYTDDTCMNIFTQNQKDRMLTVMNNSTRRSSLKYSLNGGAINLFANDASIQLESNCPTSICGGNPSQTSTNITIYNRGISALTSATINYSTNNGSPKTYNWTGNLSTNKSATFSVAINEASSGTISASIVNTNGVTDQRSSNNTVSGMYYIPVTPSNYTYNNYVFNLQLDFYGSQTTWSLKDGSGTSIYSGGPYTDAYVDDTTLSTKPASISQNWTLNNNQCYTFTINDSKGDGICCGGSSVGGSGNGFYNIKSGDGTTTVQSGSNFTTSESKAFTINILGNSDFELSNDIYLFPNPTKNIVNIQTSTSYGLPDSIIITNSLSQMVFQKKVEIDSDLAISTSFLSNGIYFISLLKNGRKNTLKFIKQ